MESMLVVCISPNLDMQKSNYFLLQYVCIWKVKAIYSAIHPSIYNIYPSVISIEIIV